MPAQSVQIPLDVSELPDRWYNILPDLPEPLPPPADPAPKERRGFWPFRHG